MDAPAGTYEYWLGPSETRYSPSGVERPVKPADPIRRARAVLDIIGVTKVADVTDLDRVGIPNFITVRPHEADGGISYYNGKGTTRDQAEASALMEAVERHAGEDYAGEITLSSYYNLRLRHPCIDPAEINVPMVRHFNEDLRLEWALGFDLVRRTPTFAPLNCVVCPYMPSSGMMLFYSSTNGLASGNTRADALCHALCEVIERDATALAVARSEVKPAIASVLEDIGFDSGQLPGQENPPRISLERLPGRAAVLVRKLQRAGFEVQLRNLTSSVGIAMGGGTDVALETADAALLKNRVTGVAELIALSRATLSNIWQNIALALGLKSVFLVTTLVGATPLWMAILADTGATVLVTANALRLLRLKVGTQA